MIAFHGHRVAVILLIGCAALIGCGGRGGAANTVPTGSSPGAHTGPGPLDSPNRELLSVVGGGVTNNFERREALKRAAEQYRSRIPQAEQAALGFALATAAKYGDQIADSIAYDAFGGHAATDNRIARLFARLILWKGDALAPVGNLGDILPTHLITRTLKATQSDLLPLGYAGLKAELVNAEPDLREAEAELTDIRVSRLDGRPLVLSAPTQTDPVGIQFGRAEALALRSNLRESLAILDFLLAYNLEPGGRILRRPFERTFRTILRGQAGAITRDQYLPGTPFLSLADDGAVRLQRFAEQRLASAKDMRAAIEAHHARAIRNFLMNRAGISEAQFSHTLGYADFVARAVQGPFLVDLSTGTSNFQLTVNIPQWTDGTPPTSLQPFFPNMTVQFDGTAQYALNILQPGISDPTYGGLFTGAGVPSEILNKGRVLATNEPTSIFDIAMWGFMFYEDN